MRKGVHQRVAKSRRVRNCDFSYYLEDTTVYYLVQ